MGVACRVPPSPAGRIFIPSLFSPFRRFFSPSVTPLGYGVGMKATTKNETENMKTKNIDGVTIYQELDGGWFVSNGEPGGRRFKERVEAARYAKAIAAQDWVVKTYQADGQELEK
jgi:hypothetical protein